MEASLLGRNVKLARSDGDAEDAADDRRRQLGDHRPVKVLVTGAAGMLGGDLLDAAERPRARPVGLARAELDITDAPAVEDAIAELRPDAVINCAAWTDVDGAEADERGGDAGQRHRRRDRRGDRGRRRSQRPLRLQRLRLRRRQGLAVRRVRPARGALGLRAHQAGRRDVDPTANPRHFIVRSSWLFGAGGPNFVETMLRVGGEQPEVLVVRDQVGCPTYTWHLAQALALLIEGDEYGIHHMAAAGRCSWFEFAQEIFDQAGLECRVMAGTTEMLGRPAPRPALSLLVTERPDPIMLPAWHEGLAEYLDGARGEGRSVNLLVTGGAGFIGSTYVRHRLDEHPEFSVRVLDKLTYAGRARTSRGWTGEARAGRSPTSPTPRRSGRRSTAATRSSTSPPSPTSTARSRRPGDFIQTDVFGTYVLLEAAREAGIRHLQISTDEVYGSIEEGSFTESSPLDPSSPYSASKAGGDLIVGAYRTHLRRRGADRPRLEQLRPAPVPGEADPAVRPQRARRRPAAGLRRRHAGPQLALRRGLRERDRHRARVRRAGRGLQRRRPRRAAQHRGGQADPRAHRPRRVADRATSSDRLGHDRRYSLASAKTEALGWRRRSTSTRGSSARSSGTATTRSGGGRSARASTASTTSASTARRWADADAAGDEARRPRPARAERPRRRARLPGRDLQRRRLGGGRRRASSSSRTTTRARAAGPCAASTSRPSRARRSWSAACAGGSSTSPSTCAAARRPTASGRATCSTTSPTASSSSRSASATASACSARSPTSPTRLSSYYDPATEAGIAWDDPEVGVEWPIADPQLSERDAGAPQLAEVARRAAVLEPSRAAGPRSARRPRARASSRPCRARPSSPKRYDDVGVDVELDPAAGALGMKAAVDQHGVALLDQLEWLEALARPGLRRETAPARRRGRGSSRPRREGRRRASRRRPRPRSPSTRSKSPAL